MGQKTNPNLFRLALNQNFLANWYATKQLYSSYLKEDNLFRQKIFEIVEPFFTIASLKIFRKKGVNNTFIYFDLTLLYPKEKEFFYKISKHLNNGNNTELSKKIVSMLALKESEDFTLKTFVILLIDFLKQEIVSNFDSTSNVFFFKVNFISNPFTNAALTAKYIGEQLTTKTPFRRIVKQVLENAKYSTIKGMMIELSGRLNGVEMARTEKKKWGTIPLHTLQASIEYAQHEINTIYGIIGIKIWIHH